MGSTRHEDCLFLVSCREQIWVESLRTFTVRPSNSTWLVLTSCDSVPNLKQLPTCWKHMQEQLRFFTASATKIWFNGCFHKTVYAVERSKYFWTWCHMTRENKEKGINQNALGCPGQCCGWWVTYCELGGKLWREMRLSVVTNVYYMIYKWKPGFKNVYNDFCVILGKDKYLLSIHSMQ